MAVFDRPAVLLSPKVAGENAAQLEVRSKDKTTDFMLRNWKIRRLWQGIELVAVPTGRCQEMWEIQ